MMANVGGTKESSLSEQLGLTSYNSSVKLAFLSKCFKPSVFSVDS